ncbi:MAG: transcription antitermination factor NusB [Solobacterium sp.]|nr:transcription antitermination factor NusB [Solobacterium sp.]
MKRHNARTKAMTATYQYLLVERDVEELLLDAFETENIADIDSYFVRVVKNAVAKKDEFAGYIDRVLENWTFDRLGYIEKAILLNGCSEFDLKEISAAVIIDEAVEMAKAYCDEDTYKLINRVLDVI